MFVCNVCLARFCGCLRDLAHERQHFGFASSLCCQRQFARLFEGCSCDGNLHGSERIGIYSEWKNLILTPGIYELIQPIRVTRPHTVVVGLGFATLRPVKGTVSMTTADADGIEIAGLLFDAGPRESPVLLEVGPEESRDRHAKDPITIHDVFFRVGGAGIGRTKMNLRINSDDTLVDHTWIWRADHGEGVGWDLNTSENGLVVNGNNVAIYGLFVEHHQKFQVLWNGNGGRTYFYQSEIPYDPPN